MRGYVRTRIGAVALGAMLAGAVQGAAAKTTVTFWEVWGGTTPATIKAALAGFEASHPDIQVEMGSSGQGTGEQAKLVAAIAAGTQPDLMLFVSPIAQVALAGLLTPLDSLLAQSTIIRSADYPHDLLKMFDVNGHTYAVPGVEAGPWLGLAYNKTLFAAAGLPQEAPGSLADLASAAKKLTRIDDSGKVTQLGFDPFDSMGGWYFPDVWSSVYGLDLYDPDKRALTLDTAGMQDLFDYVKSFFETSSGAQVDAFYKNVGGFTAGKLGMSINGYWTPGNVRGTQVKAGFGYVPNVKGDHMMLVGGWGMAIPKGAKHVKEAFEVMEYLTTAQAAQVMFAKKGWLNANLSAIQTLDAASDPGIEFYMDALTHADRIVWPENIPNILDVRAGLLGAAKDVAYGRSSIAQALPNAQQQLQVKLDAMLKRLDE